MTKLAENLGMAWRDRAIYYTRIAAAGKMVKMDEVRPAYQEAVDWSSYWLDQTD